MVMVTICTHLGFDDGRFNRFLRRLPLRVCLKHRLHLHVWLVGFLPGTPSLRSLCCGDSSHLRKSRLNRSQTNQSRPLLLAATFISRLYASQKIMTNQSIHIYIYLHIRIQIYIYTYYINIYMCGICIVLCV